MSNKSVGNVKKTANGSVRRWYAGGEATFLVVNKPPTALYLKEDHMWIQHIK